jgi:hypothetical protein
MTAMTIQLLRLRTETAFGLDFQVALVFSLLGLLLSLAALPLFGDEITTLLSIAG